MVSNVSWLATLANRNADYTANTAPVPRGEPVGNASSLNRYNVRMKTKIRYRFITAHPQNSARANANFPVSSQANIGLM